MVSLRLMVVKFCRFDNCVCSYGSCSFLDGNGNVRLCSRRLNPCGRFRVKVQKDSAVVPNKVSLGGVFSFERFC